jgi:hypothetical protein
MTSLDPRRELEFSAYIALFDIATGGLAADAPCLLGRIVSSGAGTLEEGRRTVRFTLLGVAVVESQHADAARLLRAWRGAAADRLAGVES